MSQETARPAWMSAGKDSKGEPVGSRSQPQNYVKTNMAQSETRTTWPRDRREHDASFPSSVVTGVKIIAWLMLLNTCIGAAFMLVSMVTPEGTSFRGTYGTEFNEVTLADYFTTGRLLISTGIGILLSVIVWKIVEE